MAAGDDVAALLDGLLERVKDDPDARQEFLDLLETLGPDDPRTSRLPQGAGLPALLTAGRPARPVGRRPASGSVTAVRATTLRLGQRTFDIEHRALVMGILNRTPDSFYDKGATYALDDLVRRAGAAGGRRAPTCSTWAG